MQWEWDYNIEDKLGIICNILKECAW